MTVRVLVGLGAWLGLALLVGASGALAGARPPFPQTVLAGLTLALLALYRWWPPLRAWVSTVDIRALLLVHLSRFVGIYFLVLYGRGGLPYAFAVPYGWGDIAAAVAAVLVGLLAPRRGPAGWWAYFAWNLAGLVDIVMVVVTAARLGLAEPGSMRALTVLPLSLLPTFVVPLIIASHAVIWIRLDASRRAAYRLF